MITQEKLTKQLQEAIGLNLGHIEHLTGTMNQLLEEANLSISLVNEINPDDGHRTILVVTYSEKLQKSIILDWEFASSCNSFQALAEELIRYEKEATELEKAISVQ